MKKRSAELEQILKKFGVAIFYSFGSQAGNIRDWVEEKMDRLPQTSSDIDIGVKGIAGKKWSVTEKVHLAQALEDLFCCPRVELVVISEADPFLAAEMIRGERLYALDEHEADEYDLYILRRAGDLAPLERERMSLFLGESV